MVTGKKDRILSLASGHEEDFWHGPCKNLGRRCAMFRRLVVAAAVLVLTSGALAREMTSVYVVTAVANKQGWAPTGTRT
jgi:hypothetical protein